MYFWNRYPFVRLAIALILGIIIFPWLTLIWSYSNTLLYSTFILYLISIFCSHKLGFHGWRHVNGLLALLIILLIGGKRVAHKYHDHPSNHYSNDLRVDGFSGKTISDVSDRENHSRYEFELTQGVIGDSIFSLSGKILLYISKDSVVDGIYSYGDILHVKGSFYEVPKPDNPNAFNYNAYLSKQNIFSHAFIKPYQVKKAGSNPPSALFERAYNLRNHAIKTIDKNIKGSQENGIAKALLLGIKDHLDNDIKTSYASAGAMHILAVSGLHVGIIYLLARLVFGPFKRTSQGRIFFGILSILIIWAYAIVTGLSPSVLRAATMFSVVAISQTRAKEGNIYNTLGFAAFILLLYDPYLIYSVGFQLSFAAVFGIAYLQPKFYHLMASRYGLIDKAWAITCVSVAAQVATFPLSVFYFHQFPTYFLLSNIVVIPSASVMLIAGILMLIIDPVFSLGSEIVGIFLGRFIWLVNSSVFLVEKLPGSLVDWIHISQLEAILIYSIMLSFIGGLHYRSFKMIVIGGCLWLGFSGARFKSATKQAKKEQLVFYKVKDKTIIDYIRGAKATLFIDEYDETEIEQLSFQINPNRLQNHLNPIHENIRTFNDSPFFASSDVFQYGLIAGKKILIIDSTTFHLNFTDVVHSELLLIENESVKNLEWLLANFRFKRLIIGNKNSNYYSNKMKAQAKELGLSVHSLKTDDEALIFSLL